jgi:hypothetical protein
VAHAGTHGTTTERQDEIKEEKVRKKVGSFALPVFFRTFAAHKNKRL